MEVVITGDSLLQNELNTLSFLFVTREILCVKLFFMYVFYLAVKIRNILVVSVFNVINDVMFNDNESVF